MRVFKFLNFSVFRLYALEMSRMIKLNLLLVVSFFLGASCIANDISQKSMWSLSYKVISNQPSLSVPENKTRIKGIGVHAGKVIQIAQIGTIGETYQVETDSTGHFDITIPSSDTAIYYYAEGFQEMIFNQMDFKSGHELVIELYPQKDLKIKTIDGNIEAPIVAYKPIIYAYAKAPTAVNLQLKPKGDFTFTYPVYEDGWFFQVSENGMIEQGKKTYPYLFWEGELEDLTFQKKGNQIPGFLVKTDTIVDFLEHQLTACGLNYREKVDFITFWVPRMKVSPFVLVQFLIDEDYDASIAEITLNPEPDAMRRVYMIYASYASKPKLKLKPQEFEPIDRKGFTLIEWGGSQLEPTTL